ncbi:MAG: putative lipid II flippase FtsW [Oscillospiraceae bacterium]|nr:putative lipid II flippase FtsW [Oscillospiraceae bacterium]
MANAVTRRPAKPQRRTVSAKNNPMDKTFLIFVIILLMFGLVMLASSGYVYAHYNAEGGSLHYITRQIAFAAAGLICMLFASVVDYHILRKFSIWIFGIAFVLLIVVLGMRPINGAHRWIFIGPINFQPSEIMKFAIIVLFALIIAKYHDKMNKFKYGVLPFIVILIAVAIPMLMQPHLSGTVLIMGIGVVMMFVGGTSYRWFGVAMLLVIAAVAVIVAIRGIDYVMVRLNGWLDPFSDVRDKTAQTYQSLLTIGSGGLMGVGLGNSAQKYLYLPEPHNDFIFSVACEELGFIGASLIILLFVMFVYRGFVIATNAPDKFGMMLAVGLTAQIGIQALLNIAVVTNTVPNTGISLPFFSYGGTALMMQLTQMGIILNISRHSRVNN